MSILIMHKTNGAIVRKTYNDKGEEVSSEIVVRLVYATDELRDEIYEYLKEREKRLNPPDNSK